jgi:hypothetical protein
VASLFVADSSADDSSSSSFRYIAAAAAAVVVVVAHAKQYDGGPAVIHDAAVNIVTGIAVVEVDVVGNIHFGGAVELRVLLVLLPFPKTAVIAVVVVAVAVAVVMIVVVRTLVVVECAVEYVVAAASLLNSRSRVENVLFLLL